MDFMHVGMRLGRQIDLFQKFDNGAFRLTDAAIPLYLTAREINRPITINVLVDGNTRVVLHLDPGEHLNMHLAFNLVQEGYERSALAVDRGDTALYIKLDEGSHHLVLRVIPQNEKVVEDSMWVQFARLHRAERTIKL